ncbi:thioredoxin-disulfide reductase [Anaplasmataceae bacterium AB001_6]|nr:thioredoxin-disulfide reductase [Anaplasmataceae bacterium AB001_6]
MSQKKIVGDRLRAVVIGSGPAGCTASIYFARANIDTILISGDQKGGQLTITTDVENFPGFSKVVQGPFLMSEMILQAKNCGVSLINDNINSIKILNSGFELDGYAATYNADVVVIATGAQAKWLGIPSEDNFRGYGVSGCATCDGMFFSGKDVAVIGGGNTAVEEALYLTRHVNKVYLVHRRDALRADKVLQNRLFNNEKIQCIWNRTVSEILGNEEPKYVTGVRLTSTVNEDDMDLKVEGVFIAIGHSPNTTPFKNIMDLDDVGYIKVKSNTNTYTNIPGIFVAGDVHDKFYKQAVTAAGYGCMAALDAIKFLEERSK